MVMVPVPVTVRLVDVVQSHADPEPETVQVPEPSANVRLVVPLLDNVEIDTLLPFALNVPAFTLKL